MDTQRANYSCATGCYDQLGFAHVGNRMICLGCHGPAVPIQTDSIMNVLRKGQQEQVVELNRIFALEAAA